MGDDPEMSSPNAVNGVALDTNGLCLKNGGVDHGISEILSDGVVKKLSDADGRIDTGQHDGPLSPHISASPSVDNENDGGLSAEVGNCVNDNVGSESSHDSDLSHSVSDKRQSDVESEHGDADAGDNEQCLDLENHLEGDVSMGIGCPEMQNLVADVDSDNNDSQHAEEKDPSSSQKSALCAASETETESAISDSENSAAEDVATSKPGEEGNADAGESRVSAAGELQLECDGDGAMIVSRNAESAGSSQGARDSVELTCETTAEYSINCSSPSTAHVTTTGDVTSSAASVSTTGTVVICSSSFSSSSASGLSAKVDVLFATPSIPVTRATEQSTTKTVTVSVPSATDGSSSATTQQMSRVFENVGLLLVSERVSATPSTPVTRATQQSTKTIKVSVPSATDGSSSATTRQMSKVLQDVGLLLVSERVFKNLAVIQEQKVAEHQRECDRDLLEKLKTSHQNLVAKNHGLLLDSRKCWCGFRSESANVIEAHRLSCDISRRCCYCKGKHVYHSQKMMKQHLWKVHRKVGNIDYRLGGSYMCPFCPLDFAAYFTLTNHMDACRRKFWLAANLAPREPDKDIPITAARQPVKIPVSASSVRKTLAAASRTSSASTSSVSTATLSSPGIPLPRVNMQIAASATRNPAPVAQFVQIGKQVYPVLASSSVAAPMIVVNRSSASVSRVPLNSPVQTVANTRPTLPVIANSRSTNALVTTRPITPEHPHQKYLGSSEFAVCSVCGSFVRDNTALLIHMHKAHGTTHKLCQYCCSPHITFSSVAELHSHIAKFHTSACWICKASFQPADRLLNHVAERHKVTVSKMLELRRCYFCPSVPLMSNYTAFEEHMTKVHPLQFADIGKLWDSIISSQNVDKSWYAKQNPDGTLECPMCWGQFISRSFLFRHFHLEHNGNVIRLVNCPLCVKRVPANILQVHLVAAHTRKCSIKLTQVDLPDDGCIFLPPVGTKRLKNRRGQLASSSRPCPRPLKRVKTAETVVISDSDDEDDTYDEETHDDTNDEDFVVHSRVKMQPTPLQLRSTRSRVNRHNSSTDDVHEVLESIVDSGESETIARRSVGYVSRTGNSIRSAPVGTAAATQLGSGITEDEVEIIDSIVPRACEMPTQPADKATHNELASVARTNSAKSHSVDVNGEGDFEVAEHNGDGLQSSTESQSTSVPSSAEHLMERNQIMSDSVEEVMEVDGETLLIVHDDDSDDDDDDDESD